ncbi:MAG: hypothetical protein ACI97A_004179 [Planctomycetota bacterium]|jgi:hypothetical protein
MSGIEFNNWAALNDRAAAKRFLVNSAVELTASISGVVGFVDDYEPTIEFEYALHAAGRGHPFEPIYHEIFSDMRATRSLVARSENGQADAGLAAISFLAVPILRGNLVVGMIGVHGAPVLGSDDADRLVALCRTASVVYESHEGRLREITLQK